MATWSSTIIIGLVKDKGNTKARPIGVQPYRLTNTYSHHTAILPKKSIL